MFWKTSRKKQLLDATHAECPSCNYTSSVKEWNDLVSSVYGSQSPDIRRAAADPKNSFPFQCPSCFKGYSAHAIGFHESSPERKPIAVKAVKTTS
jgi:RNA polymerase subunit RPABC4/transcription elongation factor Spt4